MPRFNEVHLATLLSLCIAGLAIGWLAANDARPMFDVAVAGGKEQPEPKAKTAIKAGTATIKGKIVFAGDPPKYEKTMEIAKNFQCDQCKLPEDKLFLHADQTWIVGKDKGLANVLVRLKVPAGRYFEPSDADKNRAKEKVVIDLPCCAFEPHVVALFPSYFDGKGLKTTGQVLQLKNSAQFVHAPTIKGDARRGNDLPGKAMVPGRSEEFKLGPQEEPIDIVCPVHPMMKARLFAYDHPYAVVTKMDGTFEMKNVPVGTRLTVEFWHEAKGVFRTTEITMAEKQTNNLGEISVGK